MSAKPVPATATKGSRATDETVPIAGGAIALLALGGAAYALSRRRRREQEEAWHGSWVDEPNAPEHETVVEPAAVDEPRHDPVVHEPEPAVVAPSAFAWGNQAPEPGSDTRNSDDDRLPGETWVQRAYRGPSANNPSVSLKARLRRAAFFDKRERDVAAGLAEPVDADAGLPEAMTDDAERELA